MKKRYSSKNIFPANPKNIRQAANVLFTGNLVGFPTETVYGLGSDATQPAAVERIFLAKGRPKNHPVIVHVAGVEEMAAWSLAVPEAAWELARALLPGPLTFICQRQAWVDDAITGGQDSIGLRVPAHPIAQALLAEFAKINQSSSKKATGIAAPSANRFGRISPTKASHVAAEFFADFAVSNVVPQIILDGGDCSVGLESTILDVRQEPFVILRPGGISAIVLAEYLGYEPQQKNKQVMNNQNTHQNTKIPRVSGNLSQHYAPQTPAHLLPFPELLSFLLNEETNQKTIAVLSRQPFPSVLRRIQAHLHWQQAPLDAAAYGYSLYNNLRQLDALDMAMIVIEAVPQTSAWVAVADRLARATSTAPLIMPLEED